MNFRIEVEGKYCNTCRGGRNSLVDSMPILSRWEPEVHVVRQEIGKRKKKKKRRRNKSKKNSLPLVISLMASKKQRFPRFSTYPPFPFFFFRKESLIESNERFSRYFFFFFSTKKHRFLPFFLSFGDVIKRFPLIFVMDLGFLLSWERTFSPGHLNERIKNGFLKVFSDR